AEAERAHRARAVGDRAVARAAAGAAAALVERAAALQRGAAPAVRPVVAAYEALCRAEGRRAAAAVEPGRAAAVEPGRAAAVEPGRAAAAEPMPAAAGAQPGGATGDADAWAAAAEQWAGIGQPYPSAYARFREAEAALAGQARSTRAA